MSQVEDIFWSGAERGELLLARCAGCGFLQHPPTPMCPRCGSVEWQAQAATGRGRIYSWIVSHHPSQPDRPTRIPDPTPRIVVLVELEEGVRLVSNLVGSDLSEVANDLPVQVEFADVGGSLLPQFRLAGW